MTRKNIIFINKNKSLKVKVIFVYKNNYINIKNKYIFFLFIHKLKNILYNIFDEVDF